MQQLSVKEEDKLKNHFELFTSLLETHNDVIYILDENNKELTCNRTINDFFGYSGVHKISFHRYFTKPDSKQLHADFSHALKGFTSVSHLEGTHKNGSTLHVKVSHIPIFAEEEIVAVGLVLEDETQMKDVENVLQLKKEHLENSQESAEVGSWDFDVRTKRFYASSYHYKLFGLDPHSNEEYPYTFFLKHIHTDDRSALDKQLKSALQTGESQTISCRIIRPDHELRNVKTQVAPIKEDGKVIRLIGTVFDITDYQDLKETVDQQSDQLANLTHSMNVGIIAEDTLNDKLVFCSAGVQHITGFTPMEYREDPQLLKKIVHMDDNERIKGKTQFLHQGQTLHLEYRIVCSNGQKKWITEQTIPTLNDRHELIAIMRIIIDITEQKDYQHQLEYVSTHDTITGFGNTHHLETNFDVWAKQRKFMVLHLKVHRLKQIRDSLGTRIEEEALQAISKRIRDVVKQGAFIARTSEEEFVLLLDNEAENLPDKAHMEHLIKTIREPLNIQGYEFHLPSNIGVSFYPEDGESQEDVLNGARLACSRATEAGKNGYQIYTPSKDILSFKQFILERDMRPALGNEEFELHYQPRVDLQGMIKGAEALIRWNHPRWGMVSPNEFIPIAEEDNFIVEIENWVIQQVCEQLRTWKDKGLTLCPISINISPIHLYKKDLINTIQQNLDFYELEGHWLELEITETSFLDYSIMNDLIKNVKELGVGIAIDDFGSGYTSLQQFKVIQRDVVKIDKSFIQELDHEDDENNLIVSAILFLAHELNIKVVAEGVETYQQFNYLKQKNCEEIQGYYFSKPLPIQDFETMMMKRRIKPDEDKQKLQEGEDRRKYFRVHFDYAVQANMGIVEYYGKSLGLGRSEVLVEDIGIGGLRFMSPLKLPVNPNISLNFTFELNGKHVSVTGTIVWHEEVNNQSVYHYGVQFIIEEQERDKLASTLNQVYIMQQNNKDIPDTTFIKQDPYAYLEQKQSV